jgi:DNA-binding transcriptional MerR regulator
MTADLILSSEAARICGVSLATVHHWERTGRLSALKTARGVRLFDRAEVVRFAQERERRQAELRCVIVDD